MPEVKETLKKIKLFTDRVVSGKFKGYTGKAFTDVVKLTIDNVRRNVKGKYEIIYSREKTELHRSPLRLCPLP